MSNIIPFLNPIERADQRLDQAFDQFNHSVHGQQGAHCGAKALARIVECGISSPHVTLRKRAARWLDEVLNVRVVV